MNTNMNGKSIAHIDLKCDCHGNPMCKVADRDRSLMLSATHHGDHDEFWVIELVNNGTKEVARYNVSSLDRIVWL